MSYNFSKLYINPEECPTGVSLCEHFPDLGAFPEFRAAGDERIKIAIYSGDLESPFVAIRDRKMMMEAIFSHIGIDISKEDNKLLLDCAIRYSDNLLTDAWLRYLSIVNDTEWVNLELVNADWNYFISKSNDPQKEEETDVAYNKRRNETRDIINKLGEKKKQLEAKLFPDSKSARAVAKAQAKKRINLYAEKYASDYDYK